MIITEMNQCWNSKCSFNDPGKHECRLKTIRLDSTGKCVYGKEKESIKKPDDKSIIIENLPKIMIVGSREYIQDEVVPEIIVRLEKGGKINIKMER